MKPSKTYSTSTASYEYGNAKVNVTDTTVDGKTERRVQIINKTMGVLNFDGPTANDLAAILQRLSL